MTKIKEEVAKWGGVVGLTPKTEKMLESATNLGLVLLKNKNPAEIMCTFGLVVLYTLQRWRLSDGRIVKEYIQEQKYSKDNHYFLALKDEKTDKPIEESFWEKETIEIYLQDPAP